MSDNGDEVFVQNTTFIASANAVEMVGATPVFVDAVSYDDLTIDLNKIILTEKSKAMVVVPLFGTACSNIAEIQKLMEDALPLSVPLIVECGMGANWLQAH